MQSLIQGRLLDKFSSGKHFVLTKIYNLKLVNNSKSQYFYLIIKTVKKFLTIIYIFWVCFIASQQKIKVIDAENNQPIPYAKIIFIGKDYSKNTEENGEFTLSESEEIDKIVCFGYEDFLVKTYQNVYSLKPKYKEIDNVEISKPINANSFTLGEIIKNSNHSFIASKNTWGVVDLFKNDENTSKTFIKKIKFLSKVVDIKNPAKINLVFYKNENGKPSNEIWKSFIISCEKGKKINEVSFEKNPILFPKEGVFIGFEWIMNEENSYTKKVTNNYPDGTKTTEKNTYINPSIFCQDSEQNNLFIIIKSRSIKFNNTKKFNRLSIELDLTD